MITSRLTAPEAIVKTFWQGINHLLETIASPTALNFPVEQICQSALQAGILTIAEGAALHPGTCPNWP